MATRFIGKNLRKRVVKAVKNSVKYQNYTKKENTPKLKVIPKVGAFLDEKTINAEVSNNDIKHEQEQKKENKKQKKSKDMVNEDKLSQMETIAGTNVTKANVKVEKADKGLFERTENSTVLLTEDNKMLLND